MQEGTEVRWFRGRVDCMKMLNVFGLGQGLFEPDQFFNQHG